MSSAESATRSPRSTCAYPACTRPPRPRSGGGGGKPPIYCDVINEDTGKYAHTPVTARREEQRRARHAGGHDRTRAGVTVDADDAAGVPGLGRSATAARERAGTLVEQFRADAAGLAETIAAALAEIAAAVDPDRVRAELDDASRHVERVQFEAGEQVKDAHRERDQARAAATQLSTDRDEAVRVRDQAIDDLERAERDRDAATAAAEQVRADTATAIAEAQRDAEAEIGRVRQQAAADIARIQAEAMERVSRANRERDDATVSASRAEAIATRAADDAERLRTELADLRREHKKELADLRADGKAALVDQAAQLRDVYEAEITRLTNQLAAMTATPIRASAEDQPENVEHPSDGQPRRAKRSTGS